MDAPRLFLSPASHTTVHSRSPLGARLLSWLYTSHDRCSIESLDRQRRLSYRYTGAALLLVILGFLIALYPGSAFPLGSRLLGLLSVQAGLSLLLYTSWKRQQIWYAIRNGCPSCGMLSLELRFACLHRWQLGHALYGLTLFLFAGVLGCVSAWICWVLLTHTEPLAWIRSLIWDLCQFALFSLLISLLLRVEAEFLIDAIEAHDPLIRGHHTHGTFLDDLFRSRSS